MTSFLNVADYERAARERLPTAIYDYIAGGAWDEVTLKSNCTAYDQWRLRPRMMVGVGQRDLTVNLLGTPLSMPIGIAPTAYHKLADPEGELATVRAAGAAGTLMCVSTMATTSLEDVAAAATGPLWFQTYIFKDRGFALDLAARAKAVGYRALVLTLDTPVLGRRERDFRNHFELPPGIEMRNLTLRGATSGQYESPMARMSKEMFDPTLTWQEVAWFVETVQMPVLVKGILSFQDVKPAREAGIAGLIVSNHGGRQLDGAIATLDALREIAPVAQALDFDVMVDGGVRRGTDVLKALALGAKMVFVGRPVLWGLAMEGEAGVRAVLEILRSELDTALALLGCSSVAAVDLSYLMERRA